MRKGRRAENAIELETLRRHYDMLLSICRKIHRAAEHAARQRTRRSRQKPLKRQIIWNRVKKIVYGMPGCGEIFGGEAFTHIPHKGEEPRLEDPCSWKPHQLAISPMRSRSSLSYQTIARKIKPTKIGIGSGRKSRGGSRTYMRKNPRRILIS
jgi:hypothetical protein